MIRFPSRAVRDRYERSLLREETTRLSLETTAKLRNGRDIVHDWDNENDFSMWASAFAVLKPPRG
jgi:hypothetical protein